MFSVLCFQIKHFSLILVSFQNELSNKSTFVSPVVYADEFWWGKEIHSAVLVYTYFHTDTSGEIISQHEWKRMLWDNLNVRCRLCESSLSIRCCTFMARARSTDGLFWKTHFISNRSFLNYFLSWSLIISNPQISLS